MVLASTLLCVFILGGIGSIALLAAHLAWTDSTDASYRHLETLMDTPADSETTASTLPSSCVAWLTVAGTNISYPVAQTSADLPEDYYLTHTAWGEANALGCPYLDRRSNPDNSHLLVFGHHVAGQSTMFGALADCASQGRFKTLGEATWRPIVDGSPSGEAISLTPLCSFVVPARYTPIQRFLFASQDALESWLTNLIRTATARAPNWKNLVGGVKRVLSLATCTEGNGHSEQRTIVIFVE